MTKEQNREEIKQATTTLRRITKGRVFGQVCHYSASGMTRTVRFFVTMRGTARAEDDIMEVTGLVARVCNYRIDRHGGIPVSGGGFCAIGYVAHALGYAISTKIRYYRL